MSRIDSLQSVPTACAAAASAIGTGISVAADVALQLFGVPLPVLLAALTGALGARVFLPPVAFWRAAAMSLFWTLAGAFLAQLALWAVQKWLNGSAPTGALAGVALVISALGQRIAPILWNEGGEALKRKFRNLWNGSNQ